MNIVKTQYKGWKIYYDDNSGLWTADNDSTGEQAVCKHEEDMPLVLDDIDKNNT
jgi:hypothetical protein